MIAYKGVTRVLPAAAAAVARRVSGTSLKPPARDNAKVVTVKSDKMSPMKSNLQNDDIDWGRAMEVIRKTENGQLPTVDRAKLHREMSVLNPTYSVATLVNDTPVLQKLVDLGVDLSHWEARKYLLSLHMAR